MLFIESTFQQVMGKMLSMCEEGTHRDGMHSSKLNLSLTDESQPPRQHLQTNPIQCSTTLTLIPNHVPQMPKCTRFEPSFKELLAGPEPHHNPLMLSNKPLKMSYYFNRDDHYFRTLNKMLQGIIVQARSPTAHLSLDQATASVVASALVTPAQLQITRLSHRRFLGLLPSKFDRDNVVAAILNSIWDEGFTFCSYSPLTDTFISIPLFKL